MSLHVHVQANDTCYDVHSRLNCHALPYTLACIDGQPASQQFQ